MTRDDPIDRCRYRARARGEGPGQVAECRLLVEVTGLVDPGLCEVGRDACEYCCRAMTPSPAGLNPVVASLLHGIARRVIERGGADGCPAGRADALRLRAEALLDHDPGEADAPYRPARSDLPCHYLGGPIGIRHERSGGQVGPVVVSRCHHPDHAEATESDCANCLDWADRPALDRDPGGRFLPIPATRSGPEVRSWSVGVTTSPRRRPTLEWTLDGLRRAGWGSPHLFVDGPATIPIRHGDCPVTHREPRVGAWPNFFLGLAELVMRDPEADAYLMVQDDVAFFDGVRLRDYLESILWPGDRPGPVSLFSSEADAGPSTGWSRRENPWFLGAQAMIFPAGSARRFLVDEAVARHRSTGPNGGLANVDTVIGAWGFREGTPVSFPTPSLCRHVGHSSTIWDGAKVEGVRKEGPFVGDLIGPAVPGPGPGRAFDESAFPVVGCDPEVYRASVDRGTARMRERSVVICGLCRDVLRTLPDLAARVERLGAMFGEYRVVLYENDSIDGTAAFLRGWSEANPAVRAISERRGRRRFPQVASPERAAELASCRNVYREHLRAHLAHFDHVIVVDTDLEGGWSFDGLAHTFGQDGWDFVGSNGLLVGRSPPIYFDTWAHREEVTEAPGARRGRFRPPGRGEPLRPVRSCFGGLGVYRMACLEAPYGGDDCEHVVLHRNMRAMGFDRLFLNPSQVVLYDRPP